MNFSRAIQSLLACAICGGIFAVTGCISWEEGWKQAVKPTMKGDVKELFAKAERLEKTADTREGVRKVAAIYENIIAIEPENFKALLALADFNFLVGYFYSESMDDKHAYYMKAVRYSEQAMYTNAKFRARVDAGTPLWDACDTLTKREVPAMYWWYCAAGNDWVQYRSALTRLLTFSWPKRATRVLDAALALDPAWNGGDLYQAKAVYYALAPGISGGDATKAEAFFDKAIAAGPDRPNHLYMRALYWHVKNKNKEAFVKDLENIISRDPARLNFPYPWAAAYQRMAKKNLNDINKYFY